MGPELYGLPEWKDWFALPFIPNPESHPNFSSFFGRQWQDTLMLSLFNILSMVFSYLPPPRLAAISSTAAKIKRLTDENENLKQQLLSVATLLRKKAGISLR